MSSGKDYDYELTQPHGAAIAWRTRTLKRNWFRLPRAFKIYLIIGLVIVITILAFSTNRMLPVLASSGSPSGYPYSSQPLGVTNLRLEASQATSSSLYDHAPISLSHQSHQLGDADVVTASLVPAEPTTMIDRGQRQRPFTHGPVQLHSPIREGFTTTFGPLNGTANLDPMTIRRRDYVRDMARRAWQGYARYAWGYNELRPISKEPHHGGVFHGEQMGATIVDGIDTLFIMGLRDEYTAARDWIEKNLDFDTFNGELSVFETNIRFVGGLLSIYALTNDSMFLAKATQCAQKLLPAFDTPSGIPRAFVNMRTGDSRNADWAFGGAILSEFGSIHLEFAYLSYATGDPIYRQKVDKIRQAIKAAAPRNDGLYNNYIDVRSGQWLTAKTHVSMGGLGDSFYEYLIKAYVQSNGQDLESLDLYNEAIGAFEKKLLFTSSPSRLMYFGELVDGSVVHKMGTLACFSGGMLAMGAMHQRSGQMREHYMRLGAEIARTCRESCVRANASIGPEAFVFTKAVEARAYRVDDRIYILRPEILETYFYMWRYTHNPMYREWAWDFVQALERHCRVEAGYSGLRNVYDPNPRNLDDVQQSFFFAEVLKYLYLIFSDDKTLSLDDWVFNTEAHPFPILKNLTAVQRIIRHN